MINAEINIIVLFLNETAGTLVYGGSELDPTGTHYKDSIWAIENFIDYTGTLQLKNATY
jgi:hypothetical protein